MRDDKDVGQVFFFLLWALVIWGGWYFHVGTVSQRLSRHGQRRVLYLTPPLCVIVLLLGLLGRVAVDLSLWQGPVLSGWAFGVLLLAGAVWVFPWLGLSPRDDVAERGNVPAGWAIAGAALGLTVAYGCAVAGVLGTPVEGYAWVIGTGSLIALLVLWGILEKLAGVSEAITVDRDAGAACRLTAFLPALAALVGQVLPALLTGERSRSLAVLGGPAVLLLAAVLIEQMRTPSGQPGGKPPLVDVVIALCYVGGAALWSFLAR
jgi:hypothetical protein